MAAFKTHLAWGVAVGSGLATIGYFQNHLRLHEAGTVIILGTLGGLLPDLDSDTGKPLELMFQLLGILVPMLLYPYVKKRFGGELNILLLFFSASYLTIQYLLCPVIKRLTVHRGIMHSIPFALLCGQLTFLLISKANASHHVAVYCAIAVLAGSFVHLVLDEFYSISFKGSAIRFKRSSGTAMTFYSNSLAATLFVYLLLMCTIYVGFYDKLNSGEIVTYLKCENLKFDFFGLRIGRR